MPNEILNLYALPDANPAVPVAGWSTAIGAGVGRVNNTVGFFATVGNFAGWSMNSPLGVDGSGDLAVEIQITAVNDINSYSPRVYMLDNSGNGYVFTKEPYTARLQTITGGINGATANLASFGTGSAINDIFAIKYNPTTGSLRAFKNGTQIVSTTNTTYNAATLFGGFAVGGYNNFTAIRSATVYNVAAAPTLTIATALTPSASRTDTCTEFANGAATLSFSGVTVPVTIASGSFTWTVPMLADGVTWPRLPATGQTITLTQGGTTANTTANINLPTGHQTLRVGDVVGGAPANFASIVTDNDRMLGFHFLAAANPLSTDDTAYFTTSFKYWVYRNGDVGADTASLPRTDTLYIQDTTTGVISSHSVVLTAAGVLPPVSPSIAPRSRSLLRVSGNALQIDGAAHTNSQPVSLSPYGGIQSGINGQWLAQSVSASAGSLVVDGVTITPPKALYLSPAGKLTATPNGRPVATVRA